jgi:protein transport protein SEC24
MRCSNGINLKDYYGNFYMQNPTDVEYGGIDSDKALGVVFRIDSKLDEKGDSFFQCALLYTTSNGERRIRVHNLSIPNTSLMGSVFRFSDMDTTINLLGKELATTTTESTMKVIREKMLDKCVKILTAYRRHCASSTSPGQLILPESFKLLPLYTVSLLKTRAFRRKYY